MSEGRPYDTGQLLALRERMSHGTVVEQDDGRVVNYGTTVSPPIPPEKDASVVHENDFEHYPGKIERLGANLGRLALTLTQSGRRERASERIDRLTHREAVVADNAKKIRMRPMSDPAEKIGWTGTHKQEITVGETPNGFKGDFTNMGKWLQEMPVPIKARNPYRPTTMSERAASRRLETQAERAWLARMESRWIDSTYSKGLKNGYHRLGRRERSHMNSLSHDVEHHDEKANKHEEYFDKIAASQDWRGRINRHRINRAQRILDRPIQHPLRRTGRFLFDDLAQFVGPSAPSLHGSDHYDRGHFPDTTATGPTTPPTPTKSDRDIPVIPINRLTRPYDHVKHAEHDAITRDKYMGDDISLDILRRSAEAKRVFDRVVPEIDRMKAELRRGIDFQTTASLTTEQMYGRRELIEKYRQELRKAGITEIKVSQNERFNSLIHNTKDGGGKNGDLIVGKFLDGYRWGQHVVMRKAGVRVEGSDSGDDDDGGGGRNPRSPRPGAPGGVIPLDPTRRRKGMGDRGESKPPRGGSERGSRSNLGDLKQSLIDDFNRSKEDAEQRGETLDGEDIKAIWDEALRRRIPRYFTFNNIGRLQELTDAKWKDFADKMGLTDEQREMLRPTKKPTN